METKPTYEELEQRVKELEELEVKRKKIEEKLKESEERYSNMFSLCRDGFVIVNGKGDVIDANQAYIDLLGYNDIDDLKKINLWI